MSCRRRPGITNKAGVVVGSKKILPTWLWLRHGEGKRRIADPFAGAFMKIANDVRGTLAGLCAGFAELTIPENEPGSSIMLRKINRLRPPGRPGT